MISFIKFYLNEPLPIIQIQTRTLPVNISDGIGKEVIMKVSTPVINNNNTFYTDSNGLEMMQRILNYRPSFQVNLSEIISGNYYPVYSAISIQDVNSKLKMTYKISFL